MALAGILAAQRRATEQQQQGQPLVRALCPVCARPELNPSFRTPRDYRVRLMTTGAFPRIEAVFRYIFRLPPRQAQRHEPNLVSLYEDLASGGYPGHGSPCNISRTCLCRHCCLPISDVRPMRRTSQTKAPPRVARTAAE